MKRLLGFFAAGLAALPVLAAGPVSAQTLEETLVRAYANNPTLRAERAALRATDEEVPQALSNWRPTISASGSAGWDVTDSTSSSSRPKSADVTYPVSASLSISQSLYRGGRTRAAIDGAENTVFAGRASLADTEQAVLLSAATAYADVVRDQAVLELNLNNERVLQRQLEATGDRFRVGEVTRTDVSQAESRLSRARADRISSEGSLIDSRASYENVVGEPPGVLRPAQPLEDLPDSLDSAISVAKANNYSVIEARYTEDVAKNSVDEIEGELLPTVSLSGSLSRSYEASNRDSESDSASITASISIPLYSSGSVTSRVRQAKQVVFQRRDEYSQAVRTAVEDVTSAWQVLQTAKAQISAFSSAVQAAEIALEGVREEANVGSRTVLDVLDAEQELLDARVNLVTAQRDELVATYQLRQAIGALTAAKLGLPVEIYDVEKHYRDVRGKWWGLEVKDGE